MSQLCSSDRLLVACPIRTVHLAAVRLKAFFLLEWLTKERCKGHLHFLYWLRKVYKIVLFQRAFSERLIVLADLAVLLSWSFTIAFFAKKKKKKTSPKVFAINCCSASHPVSEKRRENINIPDQYGYTGTGADWLFIWQENFLVGHRRTWRGRVKPQQLFQYLISSHFSEQWFLGAAVHHWFPPALLQGLSCNIPSKLWKHNYS